MRRAWLQMLIWAWLFLGKRPAFAEDSATVIIHARSQLRLMETARSQVRGSYSLSVAVQLDDSPTASAGPASAPGLGSDAAETVKDFAGQQVLLELRSEDGGQKSAPIILTTDRSGAASHGFTRLPSGRYQLIARYDGDEHRDKSEAELDLDLDRRSVKLYLDVPPSLGIYDPFPVRLALRGGGQPQAASPERPVSAIELLVLAGPEQEQLFRQSLSLAAGERTLAIRLARPPPPGSVLAVEARFAGDEELAPARVRREVLMTTQARVTLTAAAPPGFGGGNGLAETLEAPQGSRLLLSGWVRDDVGPLADEAVAIEVSSDGRRHRLGSTLTAANGRYELLLPKLSLRTGSAFLSAEVTPRHRHVLVGRSAELPIVVLPPEPVSLLYFLLPLSASTLLALLLRSLRAVLPRLRLWLERLRERRSAPFDPVRKSRAPEPLRTTGVAGVTLSSRSQRGSLSLRRALDTTVSGSVHDAAFGPPIAGAVLSLQPLLPRDGESGAQNNAAGVTTVTTPEGRFVFAEVAEGRYLLQVTAPGYLSETFPAGVPHRGELQGIAVRLMPARARLHAEWQRVALAFYGDAAKLLVHTPQELLRDVEERQRSATAATADSGRGRDVDIHRLRRLTALVEQGYYSPRLCTLEMLDEGVKLSAALTQPEEGSP
jgi:hypothetical protein